VCQLAREVGLYLTRQQVRELAAGGFEIGSHTYSHAHCSSLSPASFREEIDRNITELEPLSGKAVRLFSLPYGSSAGMTKALVEHLIRSGHEAVFLSESVANPRCEDPLCLDRVSVRGSNDDTLFLDIEVLPRLRSIRNRLFRRGGMVDMSRNRIALLCR
jgi:peptidoglycan/xylan/chitin deacetylase (PgdA/CDA1 family)